ncbi:MAG TPA: LPS export ABC transporter ATP-binding protein [Vicinamibacterales bacterium]|nr:LPS export ABC transporter ATP-binding protein [Vicinamibacterales bacterium]
MSTLTAHQLVRDFGSRRVVNGVSLRIDAGEIVGLLGRNGAGKSTTFQMLAGFVHPTSGTIRIDETDLTAKPPHERARLGLTYLPQERSVFLRLSVLDNLLLPLEERGIPKRERLARAEALLADFGLSRSARLRAYAISGGEARKLEVARALTLDPRYVLLDEPFAGMDPLHVREVQEVVRSLKARGIGVLISDHNVYYAFELIDRGYVIDAGRVLVEGTPQALASSPVARAAFLGDEFDVPPAIAARVQPPAR